MSAKLRILHCLRTPTGGLFRHVHDLAQGQADMGAEIGVVCDAPNGGNGNEDIAAALTKLSYHCALGVTRIPMTGRLSVGDWLSVAKIANLAATLEIDVLHGHGPEGGAYARLAAHRLKRKGKPVRTVYAPHGGDIRHAPPLMGHLHRLAERRLATLTDGLVFDSRFAQQHYAKLAGAPVCPVKIVPNGLYRHEVCESILEDDAADFVFIGELSKRKGIDVFLEAMAVNRTIFPGSAIIVGHGPDEARSKQLARKLGLDARVSFLDPQPTRRAFCRARCVVVPSRMESFPYLVLEAAAAQMPLIATNVGAVGEIVGDVPMKLVPPDDAEALAGQLRLFLAEPKPFLARAATLQERVAERFTVEKMTLAVMDFYETGLGAGGRALPYQTAVAAE